MIPDQFDAIEITDPAVWDGTLSILDVAHPLQAWAWGEAKQMLGETVVRLMVSHEGTPIAQAQVFTRSVPRVRLRVAWIPRGPVCADVPAETRRAAAAALRRALHQRGFRLLIARPYMPVDGLPLGWRLPWKHADATFRLDLKQSTEALEKGMHRNWRHNRNRFFKSGGLVTEADGECAVEPLVRLHHEVNERKGLVGNADLVRAVWRSFRKRPSSGFSAHVLHAVWEGRCVAAILFIRGRLSGHPFWSGFDYGSRQIGPMEGLHWEVIQRLKSMGVAWYDLEGGAGKGTKDSSGVSEFKRRMGAQLVALPPHLWAYV